MKLERMMNKISVILGAIILAVTTTPVSARPQPVPPPSHHYNNPPHHSYNRLDLPTTAAMLLISGITYAVVDGLYYKEQGDNYIYVNNPPVTQQQTTVTTTTTTKTTGIGQITRSVPHSAKTVIVDGVTYYVANGTWYAPIAGNQKFVIVEPQL